MRRLLPFLATSLLSVFMVTPMVAAQVDTDPLTAEIVIKVAPRAHARIPIAVAEPRQRSERQDAQLAQAAAELHGVLSDDLSFSGVFDLVPRELHAQVPLTTPESVPYESWVSIGAGWLVLTDVLVADGELVVEGRLFETKSDRKMVLGKRYQAEFSSVRKLAHTLADAIIGQISGEPGVCRTQIAFVSDRDQGRGRELYVVDYDGHAPRRITATRKLNMSPEWSPDGEQIVYTSYARGNPDLFILPRTGGENKLLFGERGMNTSASWSPDGSHIVFASSHLGGDTELFSIRPNGAGLRRLTVSKGIDTNPAWSPNGRTLAFTSDRSRRPQIYLMDGDGLNLRRMTTQGGFNDGAAWAPRGARTRIAFAGMSSGQFHIFVHVVETDELIQLTDVGSNEAPSWSPDGRQIVYASTRGSRTDLWVMNDDGSNQRRITSGGNNLSPAWSPR